MSNSSITKPFLLLQSRPEEAASDDEYRAFLKFGGLSENQLLRVRMERGNFPPINLDEYSGVIMGGGPANFAYAEDQKTPEQKQMEPWLFALLDEIIAKDIPFLGACLGVGALVKALGGEVSFDYAEPVEATEILLNDDGRSDPLLKGLPNSFYAFVGHKEGAMKTPEPAVVLARSAVCVQILRVGQNVYATQFHPELDAEGLALRIKVYKHAGYFAPEEADPLIEAARKAPVTLPVRILDNFVQKYGVAVQQVQTVNV